MKSFSSLDLYTLQHMSSGAFRSSTDIRITISATIDLEQLNISFSAKQFGFFAYNKSKP